MIEYEILNRILVVVPQKTRVFSVLYLLKALL